MKKKKNRRFIPGVLILVAVLFFSTACGNTTEDDQGCLLYLSNTEKGQGIYQFCPYRGSQLLISGNQILDYAISFNNGSVLYSELTDSREVKLISIDLDRKGKKTIYDCGENICENLLFHPSREQVTFSMMGENPRVIYFNLKTGVESIIEYGIVSYIDISPDGRYLRYLLENEGKLRVFDLENMQLYSTWEVDNDLIGGWSPNGDAFLIGARDVEGQLRKNELKEVVVAKSQETVLFELPVDNDISQSIYQAENNFIVLMRSGVKTNTRQIVLIDRNGNIVREISNQPVYNYSSMDWNGPLQRLVFQRYDVTSSQSVPEVWIWDMETDETQMVAGNASHPLWLSK